MRSEFKRGDVIIRIDGNIKYVVVGFYLSFMWYRLLLWMENGTEARCAFPRLTSGMSRLTPWARTS